MTKKSSKEQLKKQKDKVRALCMLNWLWKEKSGQYVGYITSCAQPFLGIQGWAAFTFLGEHIYLALTPTQKWFLSKNWFFMEDLALLGSVFSLLGFGALL